MANKPVVLTGRTLFQAETLRFEEVRVPTNNRLLFKYDPAAQVIELRTRGQTYTVILPAQGNKKEQAKTPAENAKAASPD